MRLYFTDSDALVDLDSDALIACGFWHAADADSDALVDADSEALGNS